MSSELTTLEREALESFRRADATAPWNGVDERAWLGFGLRCSLEAGRVLRSRSTASGERVTKKDDGSPVTDLELEIEREIRARLERFAPAAAFIGEESGGALPARGWALAVDPVDGTWGFLSETSRWACVIAVLRDGEPLAGFVVNPVTGELAYAPRGGEARQLCLSAFGEPPLAHTLPTQRSNGDGLLVCLHPHRDSLGLEVALHEAWQRGELAVVRAPGGSPAWGMVEAARGHYVYVNAWSRSPAEPYELAAGALIVRGAGGDVVDAQGKTIDATRHAGPWLAGIDAEKRARVAAIIREAWPSR